MIYLDGHSTDKFDSSKSRTSLVFQHGAFCLMEFFKYVSVNCPPHALQHD